MKLAIIGAGPKAAAVAAKAFVRNAFVSEDDRLHIDLFERDFLLSAWTGSTGYTDGNQPLCTLAERDLGFPYAHLGRSAVAEKMYQLFSWASFAVRHAGRYEDWVLKGRNPPPHSVFADYAKDALQRALPPGSFINEDVIGTGFDVKSRRWSIHCASSALHGGYDGVLVTGSGPSLPSLPLNGFNAAPHWQQGLFDGITFWRRRQDVLNRLNSSRDPAVCIIGAGGSAGAVANWLLTQRLRGVPIRIIGRSPTLYSRRSGYFDDRLFTDEIEWSLLSMDARLAFVERQTAGVVWEYVLSRLDSDDVTYSSGDVRSIDVPPNGYGELAAAFTPTGQPGPVSRAVAPVVVDARGFDRFWFRGLLPPSLNALLPPGKDVTAVVGGDLDIRAPQFPPRFHVPGIGERIGPGAGNLMALGWIADQVLRPYLP